MVTAPAKTGMEATNKYAVINQVQTKSGIFIMVIPGARMLSIVVMMLIEPMIDDIPRMWIAKIIISIPMPG